MLKSYMIGRNLYFGENVCSIQTDVFHFRHRFDFKHVYVQCTKKMDVKSIDDIVYNSKNLNSV